MLKLLRINNIAIIHRLEVELGPGLTLLTGETGAGKSILIDALGLLLGQRASADLIRTGEERATVEGLAESRVALPLLERHGIPLDGEEIVVRREILTSGKGRATVNGALVPLAFLKELGTQLAAIHGQHEPQGLLDSGTHVALLDRHASVESLAASVGDAYRALRTVEAELAALRRDRRELERRREMLEYQLAEIEKARVTPGEEKELRQEKAVQANADRLAALCAETYALLYEDEDSVLARLGQAERKLEELSAIDDRFAPYLEARAAGRAQIEDTALFLRDYREGISVSPGRLDEIEARLALLERLERKYGSTLDEVLVFEERCRVELAELASPEEREKALEAERAVAAKRYLEEARVLSGRRHAAARDLEKRVEAELAQLAMDKSRFRVRFSPETLPESGGEASGWTERGLETAEFLLSPNPGEELRPLARIASGGELSRILLALKSVATDDAPGKTQVFDEVDAGIGGGVAEVVGRKLRALAASQQVLCVTHLPQIASQADAHVAVRKRTERGRTVAEAHLLDAEERIEEVARMLGGEEVTEAARRHAREMVRLTARPRG